MTLGCARNDVDSEELAGRLAADGFRLVDDPEDADTVVVNTCGFVEAAKKDSVDTLLAAADLKEGGRTRAVVAVGCLAERYGKDLAESLPEADAVLGLRRLPRHRRPAALDPGRRGAPPAHAAGPPQAAADHPGRPRRVDRVGARARCRPTTSALGAPASGPRAVRRRLDGGPMAPLKLASGCDRRCSFCAIPSFRGSFVSRRPSDVLAEARWLAGEGVREVFLVSENSTSYGKDLGDLRLLETLLPELAAIDGIERVRVSYLQPAETRPGLVEAIADDRRASATTSTCPSSTPARRCCGGCAGSATPRASSACSTGCAPWPPTAGVRSNVIVGFPGETEDDLQTLCDFLVAARLDVTGVFGYSDEDGTEAAALPTTSSTTTRSAPASSTSPTSSSSSPASAPRSGSARRSSWSSSSRVDEDGRSRVAPTTRAPRSTARPA